jgi:hypothetical protein
MLCRGLSVTVGRGSVTKLPQRSIQRSIQVTSFAKTSTNMLDGGCYCGNIKLKMFLPQVPSSYTARGCDCGFCLKQGASYISDPAGKLEIHVKDTSVLGRFRQDSSDNAEFLHCKRCAVLIGAIHQCPEDEKIIASVNRLAIEKAESLFPNVSSVSPRLLTKDQKVARWKEKWFQDVQIIFQSSTK